MAFKDKYGITKLEQRHGVSVFDVNLEKDDDKDLGRPCFLVIPDHKNDEHYHIELTRRGARTLYRWLNEYFRRTDE